jgi:hypothetical protein
MATIRIAMEKIKALLHDLRVAGYNPSRAVLFGFVAKGTAHVYLILTWRFGMLSLLGAHGLIMSPS